MKELYEEAVRQNEIVFRALGCTVYAAPWRFALITKIDRLPKAETRRPYDMADAVAFLSRLVDQRGAALRRNDLASWAIEFELPVPSAWVLDALDEAYFMTHKTHGLSD